MSTEALGRKISIPGYLTEEKENRIRLELIEHSKKIKIVFQRKTHE